MLSAGTVLAFLEKIINGVIMAERVTTRFVLQTRRIQVWRVKSTASSGWWITWVAGQHVQSTTKTAALERKRITWILTGQWRGWRASSSVQRALVHTGQDLFKETMSDCAEKVVLAYTRSLHRGRLIIFNLSFTSPWECADYEVHETPCKTQALLSVDSGICEYCWESREKD